MNDQSIRPSKKNNLVDLQRVRESKNNPNFDSEADLNLLSRIESLIQNINSPEARKAANLGCKIAQKVIAKKVFE